MRAFCIMPTTQSASSARALPRRAASATLTSGIVSLIACHVWRRAQPQSVRLAAGTARAGHQLEAKVCGESRQSYCW